MTVVIQVLVVNIMCTVNLASRKSSQLLWYLIWFLGVLTSFMSGVGGGGVEYDVWLCGGGCFIPDAATLESLGRNGRGILWWGGAIGHGKMTSTHFLV